MSHSDLQPAPAPGRASATPSLADFAPKNILLLGAEPRRATAALIEPVEEIYRLMGWQSTDLPADASPGQCAAALVQAVNRLENQFDISLWSEEEDRPRLHTYDPALVKGVGQAVAVADLLPPLRVWMAGLSGGTSLIAGRDALAGALCNCVATYRYSPWRSTDELAAELELLRPDVILAVGGYQETDRRGHEQVLALCRHVIDAAVKLPFKDRPLFCFAGNRQSAKAALGYWHGRTEGSAAVLAANVLAPNAGQRDTALARVLEQHHWQRSQQMPAMRRIAGWLNHAPELRSTQWAFVGGLQHRVCGQGGAAFAQATEHQFIEALVGHVENAVAVDVDREIGAALLAQVVQPDVGLGEQAHQRGLANVAETGYLDAAGAAEHPDDVFDVRLSHVSAVGQT